VTPAHPDPVVTVRWAQPADSAAMVALIRALAAFERAEDQVEIDDHQLAGALFGPAPRLFAHVAEDRGEVVGLAIWFVNFSTWTGRHGIYLEDLFVHPSARRRGAGRALLATLAQVAVARGYTRVEWAVLDWNEPAIDFYRRLGAVALDDWTIFRLAGARLGALAAGEP
jgi:GNAT superfamily N-acetyltransferase